MEYLYSRDVLENNNVLVKRNFNEFTNLIGYSSSEESRNLSDEYDKETSVRPFKVNDDVKNTFSETIQNYTDAAVFIGFKSTIELIAAIITRKDN